MRYRGWITGHSLIYYMIPLANGATTIIFEGVPSYPEADHFYRQVVENIK